jgi:hypothetical protein
MQFCIPAGGNDAILASSIGKNDVTLDANKIYFVDEQS